MKEIKNKFKKYIKKEGILYKILRKIYHILSKLKYKLLNYKDEKKKKLYFSKRVDEACKILNMKYKNSDYIVLYNPTWLGVANSTKGLFENIVPLEQVFGRKNIKKISNAICECNIKSVIFSQIVDGWIEVLREIKRKNEKIKIKVIWHANNYEVLSDYTWGLNKKVLELYEEKQIDALAFVKKSMVEFYKKSGYNTFYLMNNVKTTNKIKSKNIKDSKIRIGIYNANSRELKNIYTQISATTLIENSIVDIVPTNEAILEYARIMDLDYTSLPDYIPTEELLERIKDNDINLYITFTECSPMFPIESFESGVPCLIGNNNDYFTNTELENYIVVSREDDQEYIKEKILYCIENKEKIMGLYKKWKQEFDKKTKEYVKEFVEY